MSKILLIRHGQASLGKKNYDELSELGVKQALWLGSYLKESGIKPSRVITGSLNRHKQTATELCKNAEINCIIEEHAGWDEFDFQAIVYALLQQSPELTPKTKQPKEFFSLLKKAMLAWSANKITADLPENWTNFENRVKAAMLFTTKFQHDDPILVISSGGAISMALKHILKLENATMIDLNLQTKNSSISEIYFNEDRIQLNSFNTIPHLDITERRDAITYA